MTRWRSENLLFNSKMAAEQGSYKYTYKILVDYMKVMAMMFIPAFTTNEMTSDFLSSTSPGWVVMFLASHRTVFTFLSW